MMLLTYAGNFKRHIHLTLIENPTITGKNMSMGSVRVMCNHTNSGPNMDDSVCSFKNILCPRWLNSSDVSEPLPFSSVP